ncbi:glycoside hydrolase domain-containing protein [Ornithinibacillus californiensis]|uniref:glycoside hydrolase domain-containing protein n=1 Tax=Ornithinibacillus californiensis TaxID=161536 RepID=UPI00064E07A0|nr:glycoside hydrolase domain-containing protein [Ornithinibacillus californiensis]
MPRYLWGVDSAARVTDNLYNCVLSNFGSPLYWGRYLSTVPNVSVGLTDDEINFIRGKSVRILPIYNDFSDATGYRNGRVAAANAIYHAKRLAFPEGVFLFANTEKDFAIDEAWIRGWVDAIYPSGYLPGIYADPSSATFNEAYCTAASNNEEISDQLVIWSQEPTPGPSNKTDAPTYKPVSPPCLSNVWGWQYGENAEACLIDTNLIDARLFEGLW